jgi:hypothetical protein
MPRRTREQNSFGSDSFLDVVANIVGILIILIVVAGVRVSRTPWIAAIPDDTAPMDESLPPAVPSDESDADPPIAVLLADDDSATPEPSPPEPDPLPPVPNLTLPAELVAQAGVLDERNARLREELDRLAARAEAQEDDHERRRRELSARREHVTDRAVSLRARRERVGQTETEVLEQRQRLAALEQQLREARARRPKAEQLEHRLTPVGRVVTGREVHFRLEGNRISHVPVMELADQLQRDINRRKEAILTRTVYQGSVGPLEGYTMEYVLQRQSSSLLGDVRYGRASIRMGVTGWIIQPTRAVREETLEEALESTSLFQRALRREGTAATVTFWVYPDSFEIHKRLKSLAHDAGFYVASRPLPEGVPIAGSPQGSKSLAQ